MTNPSIIHMACLPQSQDTHLDLHVFCDYQLAESHKIPTLNDVAGHYDILALKNGNDFVLFTLSSIPKKGDALILHRLDAPPILLITGQLESLMAGPGWTGAYHWQSRALIQWNAQGERVGEVSLYTAYYGQDGGFDRWNAGVVSAFALWEGEEYYSRGGLLYRKTGSENWDKEPTTGLNYGLISKMTSFGGALAALAASAPYIPRSSGCGRNTAAPGCQALFALEKDEIGGLQKRVWHGCYAEEEECTKDRNVEDFTASPCGQYFYKAKLGGRIKRIGLKDNILASYDIPSKQILEPNGESLGIHVLHPVADELVLLSGNSLTGVLPFVVSAGFDVEWKSVPPTETAVPLPLPKKYKKVIVF